jgi:hypothetical protein
MAMAAAPMRSSCVALATVGAVGVALLTAPSFAATPTARYSDRDVLLGDTVHTRVMASSLPYNSRPVLQRKFPDRWRTVDSTARRSGHVFVLRVPTDRLGSIVVRVAARRHGSVVSASSPGRVRVRPAHEPVGRAGQHAFSTHPLVRWDSCTTIRWVFNPAHAPASGLRQVRRAVGRVHAATGLSFEYAGRTNMPATAYGRQVHGADVIVGWRTRGYAPFRHRGAVGVGGNRFVTGYREASGKRVSRAVHGGVVLNAHQIGRLTNGFGRGYTWGEVIMHEVGHVMGLAHTSARRQIMSPHVTRRRATWGAGDLAGLRRVGDRHGCLHRSSARSPRGLDRISRQ